MKDKDSKEWLTKYGFLKKEEMPKKGTYEGKDIWIIYVAEENNYALISYYESGEKMFKVDLKELI